MPTVASELRSAGGSRGLTDELLGVTEEFDGDVCAARAENPVSHFDDRCGPDEHFDHEGCRGDADQQRDAGVHGHEHEGSHRSHERGAQQHPQRGAQPLAVRGDGARCLCRFVHYPHGVIDSVDVPIIATRVPEYAHPGDAGADLTATEAVRLEPGERALVGTGVRIALPEGYVAFVVPRSGLAAKHGITVVNAPGTVDAGYRGEIKVSLLNTDAREAYDIAPGDRIAQLIVMAVPRVQFHPVEELPASLRGEGGFGSTGYTSGGNA